jgi:hypothetical protein
VCAPANWGDTDVNLAEPSDAVRGDNFGRNRDYQEDENRMNRTEIIAAINEELSKLERVRELLNSSNGYKALAAKAGVKASGKSVAAPARKKRVLSVEARNRIAQAQKRRWAKQRRETAAAAKK